MTALKHPANFTMLFRSFWIHRQLIWQMSKREVIGRYRGSVLGLAWSFFNPLFMLAVYTFFFTIVFKARWGSSETMDNTQFAIVLFTGLIVHALFAECMMRSPQLILGNVNMVKKVQFPLEVFTWISMGSALFHFGISMSVLLMVFFGFNLMLHWTIVFLPLVFTPFVFICIGLSWFLSSLGVYLRDVGHTIGIAVTALLFLSPVFYPITILPESIRPYLYLNPLTFIIDQTRAIVLWGKMPNWIGLAIYFAISILIAWVGFAWFQKTRKGFADVI